METKTKVIARTPVTSSTSSKIFIYIDVYLYLPSRCPRRSVFLVGDM